MTLPPDFITRTRALLGDDYAAFAEALARETPVSIRLNPRKGLSTPVGEEIAAVPWCDTGFYLPQRPAFTFDPLLHAGAYYVQEASSMFLAQAIGQYVSGAVRCLDLCAAPGGKSTLLAALLPPGSLLVSNEVVRSRCHILAENLAKWGMPDGIVTNNSPAEIGQLHHLFDVMVTDVPCSGEGMFRKDAESIGEWSPENVRLCAARQRQILTEVWEALRPGGILVYSTCTYNTEEDEENIRFIQEELGAEPLPIRVDLAWGITGARRHDAPVYRFFPHKTRGEGFFLALLRKQDDTPYAPLSPAKNKRDKGKRPTPPLPPEAGHWLQGGEHYSYVWEGNRLRALSPALAACYALLNEKLRIVTAGIELGEAKGKDFIPAPALALSTALQPDAFPRLDLSWEAAIGYLQRAACPLVPDGGRGYYLMCYEGLPLGFSKQLGNRGNNLFPAEWRIRSGYPPEKAITYRDFRE